MNWIQQLIFYVIAFWVFVAVVTAMFPKATWNKIIEWYTARKVKKEMQIFKGGELR